MYTKCTQKSRFLFGTKYIFLTFVLLLRTLRVSKIVRFWMDYINLNPRTKCTYSNNILHLKILSTYFVLRLRKMYPIQEPNFVGFTI